MEEEISKYLYNLFPKLFPNESDDTITEDIWESTMKDCARYFYNLKNKESYDPYKTTVHCILKMFESYNDITTDKKNFINTIRVKCKDAVEYEKLFNS